MARVSLVLILSVLFVIFHSIIYAVTEMICTNLLLLIIISNIYAITCQNGGNVLLKTNLGNEEKDSVVRVHNLYRSCIALGPTSEACRGLNVTNQIQPQGANIQELAWDDGLAETAQKWANNCVFAHDSNENRKTERFPIVGQNIAVSYSSDQGGLPEFAKMIKMWFDEEVNYDFHPLQMKDFNLQGNKQIGHYTQLAWHSSFRIGCGYSFYKQGNWYTKLYVCNYGPGGNYIGESPYTKGEPNCSAYKMSDSSIPGLCVSEQAETLKEMDKSFNSQTPETELEKHKNSNQDQEKSPNLNDKENVIKNEYTSQTSVQNQDEPVNQDDKEIVFSNENTTPTSVQNLGEEPTEKNDKETVKIWPTATQQNVETKKPIQFKDDSTWTNLQLHFVPVKHFSNRDNSVWTGIQQYFLYNKLFPFYGGRINYTTFKLSEKQG